MVPIVVIGFLYYGLDPKFDKNHNQLTPPRPPGPSESGGRREKSDVHHHHRAPQEEGARKKKVVVLYGLIMGKNDFNPWFNTFIILVVFVGPLGLGGPGAWCNPDTSI